MQSTVTPKHMKIKRQVRQRDGMKCVECGMTERVHREKYSGRNLHVHRIVADGAYSLENCETLCQGCHAKHRRQINGTFKSLNPDVIILSVELDRETARRLKRQVRCWPKCPSLIDLVTEAIDQLCTKREREQAERYGNR